MSPKNVYETRNESVDQLGRSLFSVSRLISLLFAGGIDGVFLSVECASTTSRLVCISSKGILFSYPYLFRRPPRQVVADK